MFGKLFGLSRSSRGWSRRPCSTRKARSVGRARPALEGLESRLVPSGVDLSTHFDTTTHAVVYVISLYTAAATV
jgi:hypothetical protein